VSSWTTASSKKVAAFGAHQGIEMVKRVGYSMFAAPIARQGTSTTVRVG